MKKLYLLVAIVIFFSLISVITYKVLTYTEVIYSLPKYSVLLSEKELQTKGSLEKRQPKIINPDDFFQKSYDTIGVYVFSDFGEYGKMFGVVGYSGGKNYITTVFDYELGK